MSLSSLDDITLRQYKLNDLGNLARLRSELLAAPAEICIERAKYITEYMKSHSASRDITPQSLRAGAIRHYLVNKAAVFPDDNLLAGTTGSKRKSAPVYPEFIGLTIWSELDTIGKRDKNPQRLSQHDAKILNKDIFPYWIDRDVLSATKKRFGNNLLSARLLEKIVFFISGKAGCISHTVPSFQRVLAEGLQSIIADARGRATTASGQQKDFYQATIIVLEGILEYARHLAQSARERASKEKDPFKKAQLQAMATVCDNVPAKPAATFREAVNCIWLCLVGIHAENINMAISPGRLDQVLYPWYCRDRACGALSIKDALELIGCLWLKMGDNVDVVPQVSEELFGGAGTAPAITLGGVDENGEDAVNDLTYLMLRVTELLNTREPNMNARYHYEKNTRQYRDRVAGVIAATKAIPAFHNDVENIKTLCNQGVALKHARDYAIIGCVELAVAGRSYDASSSIMLNLAAPLELTLYQGRRPTTGGEQFNKLTGDPSRFKNWQEFLDAFKKQTTWLIGQAVDINEKMSVIHRESLPTPLLSALFEGPMSRGNDLIFGGAIYNSSGATHIAFADVVDSLNAIRGAVFDNQICTMQELLDALKGDFAATPKQKQLHQYLLNRTLKYGTAQESKAGMSCELAKCLYETYQQYMNYRGGRYRPAYWTMTNHAGQGKITLALPNGRRAGQPFASGITPVSGSAGGLTECLNAVAALDSRHIPGGEALNIKFTAINNARDTERLGDFVEGYFRNGGQQVQFNILSRELLQEAKDNPEKYPHLLVRVSGYSAYFSDLNKTMQDELIARTEYDVTTGDKVVSHA